MVVLKDKISAIGPVLGLEICVPGGLTATLGEDERWIAVQSGGNKFRMNESGVEEATSSMPDVPASVGWTKYTGLDTGQQRTRSHSLQTAVRAV